MSSALTTRELMDEIKSVRPHVKELTQRYLTAANRYVLAKQAFDLKEADEYLKAKANGATEGMAKRIALIKASDEKQEMEQLLAEKQAAKLGSENWQDLLGAIASTSYALNQELKQFGAGGDD